MATVAWPGRVARMSAVAFVALATACASPGYTPGAVPTPTTSVPPISASPTGPSTGPTSTAPSTGPTTAPPTTGPTTAAPTTPATGIPASLLGKDVEKIPTTSKIVALTFDAGANADGLPSILSTLSARGVPATFFLTGAWATRYPASVRTLVAGGYRLGNHSDTHPSMTTLSDSAIVNQLTAARSKILAAGGTDPKPLFRFPFGDRNAHTIAVVNGAGYLPVRWSVDTLGWKGTSGGQTAGTVVTRVVNAATPGEIVLMHIGSNPDDHTTLDAAALPTVITRLTGLGYRFVTLDALLTGGTTTTGCDTTAWRTAPYTVTHTPAVPPVPTVTGIRSARHPECGYDRIVLDIAGPMPSYQVRYVNTVTADPSDQPVTVPGGGTRFLLITLHPAQGHTDAGASTVTRSANLGYPMLKGYTVSGDFEGYLTIAFGLATTARIRTGELAGRLYLDVAYN